MSRFDRVKRLGRLMREKLDGSMDERNRSRHRVELAGHKRAFSLIDLIFDESFYRAQLREPAPGRLDRESLLDHYLQEKLRRRDLSPSPLFDAGFYRRANPDVLAADADPLLHFVLFGYKEQRSPSLLFDVGHYYRALGKSSEDDIIRSFSEEDPISHYLGNWRDGQVSPCPYLHIPTYLDQVGDLGCYQDPLTHYLQVGYRLRIRTCDIFDNGFYLDTYRDVAAARVPPLKHFVEYGIAESRRPSLEYDDDFYTKSLYPGRVEGRGIEHYVLHGRGQGLIAGPRLNHVPEPSEALVHRRGSPAKVGIGVVLYKNRRDEILRLVGSLERQVSVCAAHEHFYLWCDNDGENVEGYQEAFAGLPSSEAVGFVEDRGFGAGHNTMMERAFAQLECDYYVGINPDGFLKEDAVARLVDFASYWSDEALIEAVQCPREHPKWFNPKTFDTGWVSGACFLISKRVYSQHGGFDERFPLYCEDVDLSWSVRAAGLMTKVCPTAMFWHDVTRRLEKDSDGRRYRMLLGARCLAYKWGGEGFLREIEMLLVTEGHVDSKDELPSLAGLEQVDPSDERYAEFCHQLHFSPVR